MHSGACFPYSFVFLHFTYYKADLVIAWGGSYEPPEPPLVTGLVYRGLDHHQNLMTWSMGTEWTLLC